MVGASGATSAEVDRADENQSSPAEGKRDSKVKASSNAVFMVELGWVVLVNGPVAARTAFKDSDIAEWTRSDVRKADSAERRKWECESGGLGRFFNLDFAG